MPNVREQLPAGITLFQHGWMSANCVLFHGRQTVLVDTGHLHSLVTTLRNLRAVGGRTPADVDAVWLTHPHSDHAGGTAAFQRAGAEVWAHPVTADRVNAWDARAMWISYADQVHAQFTVTRAIPERTAIRVNDLTLVPYHTPGHATGMVALHCPEHRVLIAADALWEDGFGPLAPDIEGDDVVEQQRGTLATLAALDVDIVIPGHGPAFANLAAACARARGRLDAYARDPARAARSQLRAYFIHHLLETGGMPEAETPAYFERVPCYAETRARVFAAQEPAAFWRGFVEDTIAKGAVRRAGSLLRAAEQTDAEAGAISADRDSIE